MLFAFGGRRGPGGTVWWELMLQPRLGSVLKQVTLDSWFRLIKPLLPGRNVLVCSSGCVTV